MTKLHTLIDLENVHPKIEDLRRLVPKMTDAWVFHGPNQAKEARALKAAHDAITLVPHSGKGKNALDFHLSFYLGYVAARQPEASLVVVANDQGYDSMIDHARALGFTVQRMGFNAKVHKVAVKSSATAKTAVKNSKIGDAAKTPTAKANTPAKKAAAPGKKSTPVKKAAAKKSPGKKPATKTPTKKIAAPTKAPTNAPASADSKAYLRVKKAFTKMGNEFPHKLKAFERHVQAMLGEAGTAAQMQAVVHQLERAKIVTIAGDLVLRNNANANPAN